MAKLLIGIFMALGILVAIVLLIVHFKNSGAAKTNAKMKRIARDDGQEVAAVWGAIQEEISALGETGAICERLKKIQSFIEREPDKAISVSSVVNVVMPFRRKLDENRSLLQEEDYAAGMRQIEVILDKYIESLTSGIVLDIQTDMEVLQRFYGTDDS